MKEKIVICGGGPHSKVVIDLLLSEDEYEVAGIVDRKVQSPFGLPWLGNDDMLEKLRDNGISHAFVAIGSNTIREKITHLLKKLHYEIPNIIARDAVISSRCVLGSGVLINHGAIVNAGANIGDGVILNTGCSVDHDTIIGDYAHIAPGVHVSGSSKIGKRTFLGVGSCVKDVISIGDDVIIGAGAAVVKNIPSSCTAVGVPAKVIKTREAI